MIPIKRLTCVFLLLAAAATSSFAQVAWTNQSPAGITDDIWSVAYGNGTFAAVTNQGRVLTSSDGLVWSSSVASAGTWLVSITYGKGTWVAVGANGTILLSSDLATWLNAKSVTTNKLNGVLYNGTVFLAVGESGTILSSPDAQAWTIQASGVSGFLHGITVFPDTSTFLVSGQNGVLLFGNSDGTGFSPSPSGTTQDLEALVTSPGGGSFVNVAVGANGTVIHEASVAAHGALSGWASAIIPNTTARFRALASGDGFFVAGGELGTILSSTDGTTWVQRFSGDSPSTVTAATLLGGAYSSTLQRFVMVGTGGTILVSNPPPTVFANVSTRGFVSSTETFIGGFVVEGTSPRTVLIRGDGPVLSTFSVPSPLADPVLTVFDGNQNVVATNKGWGTNTNPASISTAALKAGAFALPASSLDSAVLLTLKPGAYTVEITSAAGNSGIALFEAYTE
ncbi:MAG TPA: hypothetical protein VII09_07345 [Opitutaceae bacterium]